MATDVSASSSTESLTQHSAGEDRVRWIILDRCAQIVRSVQELVANFGVYRTDSQRSSGETPAEPASGIAMRASLHSITLLFHEWHALPVESFLGRGAVPQQSQATLLGAMWPGELQPLREALLAIRALVYRHNGLQRLLSGPDAANCAEEIDRLDNMNAALQFTLDQVTTGKMLAAPFELEKFAPIELALRNLLACSPVTCTSDAARFGEKLGLDQIVKQDHDEQGAYFPRAAMLSLCPAALAFVKVTTDAHQHTKFGQAGMLMPVGSCDPERFPYYIMANELQSRRRNGPTLGAWQRFDVAEQLGRPRTIAGVRWLLMLAALADPEYFHESPQLIEQVAPLLAARYVNDLDGVPRLRPLEESAWLAFEGAQHVAWLAQQYLFESERAYGRRSG